MAKLQAKNLITDGEVEDASSHECLGLAALVTFFSLLSSLIATGETEDVYQASMTQLLDFFRAF